MSGNQRLELKQAQSLIMTPQLQQSIKLLQLSSVELSSYLTEELEKNPLLISDDPGEEREADNYEEASNITEPISENSTNELGDVADIAAGHATGSDKAFEGNYSEAWEGGDPHSKAVYRSDDMPFGSNATGKGINSDSDYDLAHNTSQAISLKEHISEQITVEIQNAAQRIIALHLVDILEDTGYIHPDYELLSKHLGCEEEDIEPVLSLLQRCDPPGVFARSVTECLALQLKDKNRYDPIIAILLENLDLLAKGELGQLQKRCGVNEEELLEMIQEIKALNPKPGSSFSGDIVQTVQPDVFLKRDARKKWRVEVNNGVLPKVLINRSYHSEIAKKFQSEIDKKYITEQLQSANWLVKALDQRVNTILKVATEIVVQQQEFFEKGVRYLKPMTLTDIAHAIDMHESTVSRVTTNKYMATHLGVYELKYFFSSSIQSFGGATEFSSKSIQYLIGELIQKEDPACVLSDEKIALTLKGRGIDIARRTVAKYREALGLGSSAQRKREKRLLQKR